MELDDKTIETLIALGARQSPLIPAPDGSQVAIVPEGYRAEHIKPLDRKLTRMIQKVALYDLSSFVSYVNQFKLPGTRIFGVPSHLGNGNAGFIAVIDYHPSHETPGYCENRATFTLKHSEQWTRWTRAQPMPQVAFAEFIEENRKDVVAPDVAVLLDIVTKFRASRKQDYDSVVYQPNGDVTVAWSEKTENAGKPGVAVPTELGLGIPVYFKGELYSVPVLMRYRLADGKLMFMIKVDRPDYIEQAAFDATAKQIAEATGIEPYIGAMA